MLAGVARGAAPSSKFQSKEAASTAGTLAPRAGQEEHEFESPVPPDYTSILIALAAVKREVASIGGDLGAGLPFGARGRPAIIGPPSAGDSSARGGGIVCCGSASPRRARTGAP